MEDNPNKISLSERLKSKIEEEKKRQQEKDDGSFFIDDEANEQEIGEIIEVKDEQLPKQEETATIELSTTSFSPEAKSIGEQTSFATQVIDSYDDLENSKKRKQEKEQDQKEKKKNKIILSIIIVIILVVGLFFVVQLQHKSKISMKVLGIEMKDTKEEKEDSDKEEVSNSSNERTRAELEGQITANESSIQEAKNKIMGWNSELSLATGMRDANKGILDSYDSVLSTLKSVKVELSNDEQQLQSLEEGSPEAAQVKEKMKKLAQSAEKELIGFQGVRVDTENPSSGNIQQAIQAMPQQKANAEQEVTDYNRKIDDLNHKIADANDSIFRWQEENKRLQKKLNELQ